MSGESIINSRIIADLPGVFHGLRFADLKRRSIGIQRPMAHEPPRFYGDDEREIASRVSRGYDSL